MAVTLTKIFSGISDYVTKHETNYTLIEQNLNDLLTIAAGSSGSLSVPLGLQEIFDRDGIIGISSYQLVNQTVAGGTLTIPPGSAWIAESFRTKSTTTGLSTSGLTTGTNYVNVNSGGIPVFATAQTSESLYSFSWDSVTKIVSNTTRLSPVLFDGDDYADMLTSAALSQDFDSVADRLENIEVQVGILGKMYAQDLTTTTGLTFGFQSGSARNDNLVVDTAAGTVTLTDNQTNYVEVNPNTGTISSNTVGFTTLLIPLFIVTTALGAITIVNDRRTWAGLGGGGGGGGHTQNTDIGTSSADFELLRGTVGVPTSNATMSVGRGDSPKVDVRWNENTDTWEFTNDGTVYAQLGAPNLGQQELSKFVTFEDPPLVVNETALSTAMDFIKIDLTADPSFSGILSGVQGMLLRVQYTDTVPSLNTKVLFRKIENPLASPPDSLRVFARNVLDGDGQEGTTILVTGEGLTMLNELRIGFEYFPFTSGTGTATLQVYVLGYWDKVTGVGTQSIIFQAAGNSAPPSLTTQFNRIGFANRALAHTVTIAETGGLATGLYHVKLYKRDTFLEADLLYSVQNISPAAAFTDFLPVWLSDEDGTGELHMAVQNDDTTQSAVISITLDAERFA